MPLSRILRPYETSKRAVQKSTPKHAVGYSEDDYTISSSLNSSSISPIPRSDRQRSMRDNR